MMVDLPLTLTLTLLLGVTCVHAAVDFIYHDQHALETYLNSTAAAYPDITHLYSIGKSEKGTNLWVIAIGQSPKDHVLLRPNVKYIANMHGNEVTGREMMLHLVEHYVTNYGVNTTLTEFLNTTTVHIMPTMNPDGFANSTEGDCSSVTGRTNKNGYDLNRNFPDFFAENLAPLQQETLSVMEWLDDIPFVLSINFHGGVEVVNYPFDNYPNANGIAKYAECPDDDVFIHLSKVYSYSHADMYQGLPCPGETESFPEGITNGAKWYPVTGGMQDYNYLRGNTMEVLVEMTCCKYPPQAQLPQFWEDNRDALINYLMEVHIGVKGIVTDTNNNPISGVEVVVVGREMVKFHTTDQGEYWRLLLPGQYTFQFSSVAYMVVTKEVPVVAGEVTRMDVVLPEVDNTASSADLPSPRALSGWLCFWYLCSSVLSKLLSGSVSL